MNYEITIDCAASPERNLFIYFPQNKQTLKQFSFGNYWAKIFVVYTEKCYLGPALSYE